ncbi:MAG: amino acid ABC transporter permease [Eubacteriales bacterium]|nr:amino acid ABC transporter permease [Clostridiales bacterium]MDY5835647.1 amino acid ABC transporter permease [Eubacteriales bacterium]
MRDILPDLIKKIPYTLYLGSVAFIIAFGLAIVLSLLLKSKIKPLVHLTKIYISFFRSTPYIMQLFILYFGLPQAFPAFLIINAEMALIISIAMNSAAFIAEIIRGSLLSVEQGQIEAGLACGLSKYHIATRIVIPQAAVSAIPSLGNSYINMIKSTSVGFTIGVVEMLSQAKIGSTITFNFLEAYLVVGLLYWIIVVAINKLQALLESHVGEYLIK